MLKTATATPITAGDRNDLPMRVSIDVKNGFPTIQTGLN